MAARYADSELSRRVIAGWFDVTQTASVARNDTQVRRPLKPRWLGIPVFIWIFSLFLAFFFKDGPGWWGRFSLWCWYVSLAAVPFGLYAYYVAKREERQEKARAEEIRRLAQQPRPQPPAVWSGTFIAVYPDGARSEFDLAGTPVRRGEKLGSTGFVLDRWETSEMRTPDGNYGVIGYLRAAS